jgi:uncharacterized protein (TIRG00374 family)
MRPRAPLSRRTRALRYLVGAILGAAALYACFARIEWQQFKASFQTARASWVAAAVLSVLVTLALVTVRWALLLDARGSPRSWRALWHAVVVGQAVNIVFPLRFGEGARLAFTSRELGLPAGRVMVGLALERTFDVAMFAAAVLLLIVAGWIPGTGVGFMRRLAILAITSMVAVACVVWLLPAAAIAIRRRFGLESPIGRWIEAQVVSIRTGWAVARRPRLLVATGLLTAMIAAAAAATNLLIFRAFDLQLPLLAPLALLVVLQLGTAVVSVPGNVGVFHYLTVVTLGALHVPRSTALAAAVVLHAVSLGPKVALGTLTLAATPLRQRPVPPDPDA